MSLEAKALDLVTTTLSNETKRLRDQAVAMLNSEQTWATSTLHDLVDGIAAHAAALIELRGPARPIPAPSDFGISSVNHGLNNV